MSENGTQAAVDSRRIKVEGLIFSAPAPYKAGHVLEENEAATLNQTYSENLRNNFAKAVKKYKEEAEKNGAAALADGAEAPADLQNEFNEYASDYKFGVRTGGGGDTSLPRDPVLREAHLIARELIRAKAKEKGLKVDAEQVAALVPGVLEKRPTIMDEARRRVESKSQITLEELELPEAPPAETSSAGPNEGDKPEGEVTGEDVSGEAPRKGRRR